MDGLFGNTTTLTSDFTWVIQLVRDRAGDLFIVDNVTTSADPEPSGGGGTLYKFRPQERVMAFKTYPLMAGDKLYLRYRVNSNPGQPAATDNYFINRSRLYASRVL